jgi:hypothetical protein
MSHELFCDTICDIYMLYSCTISCKKARFEVLKSKKIFQFQENKVNYDLFSTNLYCPYELHTLHLKYNLLEQRKAHKIRFYNWI